jgi:aminopeptidase N
LYDGTQDVAEVLDPSVLADTHLSASIATFTEVQKKGLRNNYYMVVYKYGDETIKDLRNLLGDKQFFASMQAYFNEMKFGVSSTADFIRIMEQTSKKDLSKFFEDHRVYAADQQP